jgi:tRNA pseudouridine55 synthase
MKFEQIVNAWYGRAMSLHLTYKAIGETPLQALKRLRKENNIPESESMTYAGRLDPAAEGLLLILSGSDVYRKENFLGLSKTYEFEVLFGVSTDSLDVLGLVLENIAPNENACAKILAVLDTFVGTFEWPYPDFSSKTVDGKSLIEHTREGNEIEIPLRSMTIETIDVLGTKVSTLEDLEERILTTINSVDGDFRQEEIMTRWREVMTLFGNKHFCVVKYQANVRSGTYIRTLAEKMGEAVGLPALALSIKRTKIGSMSI